MVDSGWLFPDRTESAAAAGERLGDSRRPLAERMRPRTLEEVVGQDALVGPEGFLRRAMAEDRVPSLIFWGPPGSGKTTLARLIASATRAHFVPFSAVTAGIAEIRRVMLEAERARSAENRKTLLFLDEIHRFNRAQQDAFLPFVEQGSIVLVGATTENPSFELNAALLSRCRVVVLEPIDPESLRSLVHRALSDVERGLGRLGLELEPDAEEVLLRLASGDARKVLTLLEVAAEDAESRKSTRIDRKNVEAIAQRKVLLYDKHGEEHFNLISALHKSLRESDPDAALYWLARMLEAGEDPNYVARRMVRFAVEDVGLADPGALSRTLASWEAYERLGSPEGELALARAAIDLALAPKSISTYRAWGAARRAVAERPAEPVPLPLRNAPTRLLSELGYGEGYVYAPATEEGIAGLECLPPALAGARFYEPVARGREQQLAQRLEEIRRLRAAARKTRAAPGDDSSRPDPRPSG